MPRSPRRRPSIYVRPRLLPLEDRVTPAGNLHITAAQLVDGNNVPEAAPVTGQMIFLRADWTTTGLAGGEQYVVRYSVDGVPADSGTLTGAAGTNLGYELYRGGWYAAPGTHTVTVTVDGANAVAETNETDNSITFTITTVPPSDLPSKFLRPISGTLNKDWAINNYADVDPRPGIAADYRGGPFQYDSHDAIDAQPWGFDRMDAGMPIYAAADGVVTEVLDGQFDRNTNGSTSDGNHVRIDHGNGWSTLYYHFARGTITVKVGDVVKAGQVIGLMGSSGNSSTAHLHFTPYYRNAQVEMGYDTAAYETDPMPYGGDVPAFLFDAGVTNYDPSPDIGEHPSPISSFSTTQSGTLSFWTTAYGQDPGDSIVWKYYRPDGSLFSTNTVAASQSYRFGWWYFTRPLSQFQSSPGTWQVGMEVNGVEQKRYSFSVTAGGAVSSIRVTDPAGGIVLDRRTTPYDFGTPAQGTAAPTQTFTVNNHGAATLTLSNPILPPGFSLVALPASIPAGGSAQLTLRMDTSVVGAKFGAVQFNTNDPDTPTFHFNVSGTVTGSAPAGAPAITLPGPALAYNFGALPVPIAPAATLTDSNSANFGGGQLVVEFASNGATTDRVAVANQGTGPGQVGFSGTTVTYGGTPVGTTAVGVGPNMLVVFFNAAATPAAVQAVMRAVTYANVSPTPLTAPRWVRFTVTDDTGLVSNMAIKTVVNTGVPQLYGVQAVAVGDGSAQRSVVRSLTVTFGGPVTFPNGVAAAFTLTRTGPTGPTGNVALTPTVSTNALGQTVVALTFSGTFAESNTAAGANPSLIDGIYSLTVFGSAVAGPGGVALDGNNAGIPGGDYALATHRLFGDVDGDGDVDLLDLNPLVPALFGVVGQPNYNPAFDFEGDGDVDLLDLNQFVQRLFLSGYTP
ncbi:MAG TPA: peptidoglycan DD-metalloendopeptidase family protein [Gemmataceae bacterium]|jgi:hypothetical protein